MKERPIIFKPHEVRATLDGRQSQFRRLVKPQPQDGATACFMDAGQRRVCVEWRGRGLFPHAVHCPYGATGDRLWVRESWAEGHTWAGEAPCVFYRATNDCLLRDGNRILPERNTYSSRAPDLMKWRPSLYMPRWASRITLEVTNVRVERLQDIQAHDAMAEGCGWENKKNPVVQFRAVWQSIHGPESWEQNPWLWVVEFKRIEP